MNRAAGVALAVLCAAGALYVTASSASAATATGTATRTPAARATTTRTAPAPNPAKTATGTGRRTPVSIATRIANWTATKAVTRTVTKAVNRTATKSVSQSATKLPNKAATRLATGTGTKNATAVQARATLAAAPSVPTAERAGPTRTAFMVKPSAAFSATRAPVSTQVVPSTATPVPPPAAPATAVPPAGAALQLPLRDYSTVPGYDRNTWKHWVDTDNDCQDTRAEVLIAESSEPVTFTSSNNCTVLGGRWYDPYTNAYFTIARELDVDHFVPLGNAHNSGGADWATDRKLGFANSVNDADHLIAVSASANRSKGSRAPDEWKPPNQAYWCEYAYDWIRIKAEWGLSATRSEWVALQNMTATCPVGFTAANAAGAPAAPGGPPAPPATSVVVVVPTEVPVVATAVIIVVVPTEVPVAPTVVVAPVPPAVPTDAPTAAPAATAVAGGQCAPGQVDVNSASLEDLQRIIHIGATRAEALIALRPFASVSDLARISGIGSGARLAQIKAENLACVN